MFIKQKLDAAKWFIDANKTTSNKNIVYYNEIPIMHYQSE